MKKFKKLTAAAAVSAVLGGMAMPAQAVIQGVPGEALLVPFVLYSGDGSCNSSLPVDVNTYIALTAPSRIGQDTVFNQYTAPNTTGTPPYNMPAGTTTDVQDGSNFGHTYHWFFFNSKSEHVVNEADILTPDDIDILNWRDVACDLVGSGALSNVPGYLVITNNAPTIAVPPGSVAANFVMFGDATMQFGDQISGDYASIPVMAMADGVDATYPIPRLGDEVKYDPISGIPNQVSPVVTGMRMNNGDGDGIDTVLFDMVVGPRGFTQTLHVLWFDQNGSGVAQVTVFDEEENDCSATIDIDRELNLVLIDGAFDTSQNLTQPSGSTPSNAVTPRILCNPGGGSASPADSGMILYTLPELNDTLGDAVDSGAVAFSIIAHSQTTGFGITAANPSRLLNGGNWAPTPNNINTAFAHERGKINN